MIGISSYTEATLCFPIRADEVLLGEKQAKIGAGLLNGFGGKVDSGDSDIIFTNAREVREEIGINVTSAREVGKVFFHNPSKDASLRRMMVHIFIATHWDGMPAETEEMKKIGWYNIENLDYSKFLAGDRLFLPQVLGGKYIRGIIEYNEDWSVKASDIQEVERL